jgi:hypothetical protein
MKETEKAYKKVFQGEIKSSKLEMYKDLLKVQKEIKTLTKDSVNPHLKSKYTTLKNIIEYIKPILNDNNFILIQLLSSELNVELKLVLVHVKTILQHLNGEKIETTMMIAPSVPGAQGVGSAITYGKRYSITSLLGLVDGDEDDDGEKASVKVPETVTCSSSITANANIIKCEKCDNKGYVGGSEAAFQRAGTPIMQRCNKCGDVITV